MSQKSGVVGEIIEAIVALYLAYLTLVYGIPVILSFLPPEVYLFLFAIIALSSIVFFFYIFGRIILLFLIPSFVAILYFLIVAEAIESKIIYSLKENNNKLVVENLFINLEQTPLVSTDENCEMNCKLTHDVINNMLDDGDLITVGERSEKIQLNQEVLLAEKELVDFKNLIIIWNETIWPAFLKTLAYVLLAILAICLLILLLIWHLNRTLEKDSFLRTLLIPTLTPRSPNVHHRSKLYLLIKQLAKRKMQYESAYKKDIEEGSKKSFEKLNHLEIKDIKNQMKQQGIKESFKDIFEEEYANVKNKS